MANTLISTIVFSFFLLLLLIGESSSKTFSTKTSRKSREKLSHLHFYFYDRINGRNPTSVQVASIPKTNSSPLSFGSLIIMDDPLTVGPDPRSKQVGRAQGIYASAAANEIGLLMVMNCVFTEGKYNGSSISILGRNAVLSKTREMPVVGGSGLFRYARGYAKAKTFSFDLKTLDAVVEYNVYVFHY